MVKFDELMKEAQEMADVGIQQIEEWKTEQQPFEDPTVLDEIDRRCTDLLCEVARFIIESVEDQQFVQPDQICTALDV